MVFHHAPIPRKRSGNQQQQQHKKLLETNDESLLSTLSHLKRFEKIVKELVRTDVPDLWKTFKDGVLKACDEVCGKKSRIP